MATDPRKRQKQLARKAAKRKAPVTSRKQSTHIAGELRGAHHMAVAAQAPLLECLRGEELFETGMGTVIVSRAMPNGAVGMASFLLDVFCLGVKNADFVVVPRDEYQFRLAHIGAHEHLIPIAPADARKLVEDAEAYARNLGFSPHADYQLARRILADIDASECHTNFVFGQNGKPFYVVGPYDTPQRVCHILDTLSRRCGPDGFHYVVVESDSAGWLADEQEDIIEAEYRRLR
ncbi:MAG: hypothetical protein FJZ47_22460 [Candidatus Tectomicrobia bacterium]|uniref:Uncharacterized protein n=1 Tax=Tectimicrobiota bacterium TaxID=2528274 RepID=A0A937W447_UNCTE|nr:hypothetical protein [Candidatus Tectomicrobia bacterium]